jgi:hypothetical protein
LQMDNERPRRKRRWMVAQLADATQQLLLQRRRQEAMDSD